MAEQLILSNDVLKVTLSEKGAEMRSIIKEGKEQLWQGDPSVWAGRAPVLFPICGGLKDGKYIYENKEYTMQKHGYARFCEFELESANDTQAVFLLKSNQESMECYPFEYEFRIIYTLEGSKINVEYNVKNLTKGDMYFSVGSHEGYFCEEGIEEYSLIFDKEENLISNLITDGLIDYKTYSVGDNTTELKLNYKLFDNDSLVFANLKSHKVYLRNNRTGKTISVEFKGHNYFVVWTLPGAKYICLEPWCGIGDFVDSKYDFVNKAGINKLSVGETFSAAHTIKF